MELVASLGVRLVVGIPLAMVGSFVGMVFNSLMVPSPILGNVGPLIARIIVIGIFSSGGGLLAWFNLLEGRRGAAAIYFAGVAGGALGAWAGFVIGDVALDHPDAFELGQQTAQAVMFGGALGANAAAVVMRFVARRLAAD